MGFNFSNAISNLNDALPPSPSKANSNLVGPFGGEATGFAKGVADLYSKNFYTQTAKPDVESAISEENISEEGNVSLETVSDTENQQDSTEVIDESSENNDTSNS